MATFHVGITYLLVTERCIIIIASTIVLGGMFISFWGGVFYCWRGGPFLGVPGVSTSHAPTCTELAK